MPKSLYIKKSCLVDIIMFQYRADAGRARSVRMSVEKDPLQKFDDIEGISWREGELGRANRIKILSQARENKISLLNIVPTFNITLEHFEELVAHLRKNGDDSVDSVLTLFMQNEVWNDEISMSGEKYAKLRKQLSVSSLF